ncbi:DExH-box ATP-dependent RNA helicase DExH8 [Citrus sinensis]|nr:DExH-box ATP-dependent RNA helicase DExH8 [Citrus sinensis]
MGPSSPTSSCSSSYSSPFTSPEFSSLPVMSLREKIVEKVLENRVTLIVGETGCGKSSQVPQFLLAENMEPILCTQPRRFAVVAVAKMVAKGRNCELGGEVGYHIGHSKHLSERSKIVFKTAGVLLDEMRDRGLNALKYKVTELLGVDHGMTSELSSLRYCSGPSPSMANAEIKPEVHKLIHDLVLHIHKNESDIEKSILVFLPTYYALEQQWHLMKPLSSFFKVHILHSSVDTEQALMAMKICKSHRKVILATNIAESSVTIPKVAYVIDSCRSLQVFWDVNRKIDSAELVWVSQSQAEQRRGRTGRTCDGQVYRLVTKSFFGTLEDHECPAILRLSLRLQVLLICCAESKAISDPKGMKALDPPYPEVVGDALDLLDHKRALQKISPRGRYEPTFYGRLLASFSLSFDASVLVLKFGEIGMLREGILLGILMDTQPLPILHPFGDDALFAEYTGCYFGGDGNTRLLTGRKEMVIMGNLCAFQFWQHVFKDKQRLDHLQQVLKFDETKVTASLLPKIEEEWCSLHYLVQSSLHHVSELYEDILNAVHRFRPKFLGTSNGLPTYYDPYEFEHTCLLNCDPPRDMDPLAADNEHLGPSFEAKKCVAVPFVAPNQFQSNNVAEKLASIIKEIRVQYVEDVSGNQDKAVNGSETPGEAPLCVYFINGSCNRGTGCPFSHSLQAKRPACKFFYSLQGCRNGDSCVFSHDLGQPVLPSSSFTCLPEDGVANAASLLRLFPTSSDGSILLLDDTDMHFSANLACLYDPSRIISTTCLSDSAICDTSLAGIRILWGLCHSLKTVISEAGDNPIPWKEVKCVLWYPSLESYSENLESQKTLVQNFFEHLAIRMLADALYDTRVIITMNNIKFAQLQVEKLARDSFFFLSESFPFDEMSFGELSDTVNTKRPMLVSRAISYVFDLHPPTDFQFGDYAAVLHRCLHDN